MTAGNNGAPEPDDDPFAYLYRGEGDQAAPSGRPGIPRTSYHQVGRVGERRPSPQQSVQPMHSAPEAPGQYGRQVPPQRGAYGGGGGGGLGGNRRGLMIGAVAVVAVVVGGIVVAALADKNDNQSNRAAGQSSSSAASTSQPSPSGSTDSNSGLPQQFATSLTLSGGAKTNTNHKGAQGTGGAFVDGMDAQGATATWTTQVQQAGSYTLWVRYANADGNKATSTVLVNGKPLGWKINLADYGQQGNWDQWFKSYVTVNLNKGSNTIALTCASGDTCNFNLDRIGLTTDSNTPPSGWS
jgi:Carbohydrate binding module (family 35)